MEGPSVKAIADKLQDIQGHEIVSVSGNAKQDKEKLVGCRVVKVHSIGKRLVIETETLAITIHFLMLGSYRINERKERVAPRLSLTLDGTELNFYNCSVKIIPTTELEGVVSKTDILSSTFNKRQAVDEIAIDRGAIADLLLDQDRFGGVGNIIKNEALYEAGIHPESISKNIPEDNVVDLLGKVLGFSKLFYDYKMQGRQLKPILGVYRAKACAKCASKIVWKKLGERKRMCFYCPNCQTKF
jgi:endonuclease-8